MGMHHGKGGVRPRRGGFREHRRACAIVRAMPHITQTFGGGQGLQVHANRKTQTGALDARNIDVERANVIRKRPGAREFSLARSSTDPTDLIPAEQTRAIWNRESECILETDRALYSLQRCAEGATGSVTTGTATPLEIADGLAVLAARVNRTPEMDVPLPGDGAAGSARARANRPAIPPPLVITPPARTITITISESAPNVLQYTVDENATSITTPFPGPGPQRNSAIQDLEPFTITDDVLISWIGNGTLRTLRLTPAVGDAVMTSVSTVLDPLRGATLNSSHAARENAVAGFLVGGALRVYTAANLASTRDFAVANPPPSPAAYAMDIIPTLWPTLPAGVAWLGDDDVLFGAQIEPVFLTVDVEAFAQNQRPVGLGGTRQVGVELSSLLGTAFAVALKTSAMTTEPVFGVVSSPPSTDLRVTDLGGPDLRLRVTIPTIAGNTRYELRNATTAEAIGANTILLSGAVLDSSFLVRGDQVYGGSTADGQVYDHRWRRSYTLPATSILGGLATQMSVAESADRFVLAYAPTDSAVVVRAINDVDTGVPSIRVYTLDVTIDTTTTLAIGVLTEVAALDYTARLHVFTDVGEYHSATATSTTALATEPVTEAWGELPVYASSFPTGAPPRALFGVQYVSTSQELYEDDEPAPLWVRVFPPLVVPAGGQWVERGPWRRTRLRSRVVRRYEPASNSVTSSDAAGVLNAEGEVCILNVVDTTATPPVEFSGAQGDVISTHTEGHLIIDALGERPRVATYGDDTAFVVYYDSSGDLQQAIWSPGSALSFSAFGATPTSVDTWDIASGDIAGVAVACVAWDRSGGGGILDIRVFPQGGTPFTYSRAHGLVAVDVAVFVEDLDGVLYVAWSVAGQTVGVNGFATGLDTIDIDLGTDAAIFQRTVNAGAIIPFATVVGRLSTTETAVWLETDEGVNRRVRQYDVASGSETLVRTVLRTAIASQLARLGGDLVGVESMIAGPPVPPDTRNGKIQRNGLIMRAHTDGEFVGRVAIGQVEDFAERQERTPHTGLNTDPTGRLVLGWQETSFTADDDLALTSSLYVWDPNVGAHDPGVIDGVAVAAHGGYPRMTEGQQVHEHDWHHLPEILSVVSGNGGQTLAGSYRVALTFEDRDARGLLYRSRPTFSALIVVPVGALFNVTARGITHTERTSVNLVWWQTQVDSAEFYRVTTIPAVIDPLDQTLAQLNISDDELLTRERLDQGEAAGFVLESDPIGVTDFLVQANGRFWSRDPRDGTHARFSLTSRALDPTRSHVHWNLGLQVNHTGVGDLTAVAEMDARALLMSNLDVSAVYGDGPTNTGGGTAYNVPATVPVDIGPEDHASMALIPEGLVYWPGPGTEVQLLARTFQNVPLASQISNAFHGLGQSVVASVYVKHTDTLMLFDGAAPGGPTATLRYSTGTQRWSYDSLRQAKDATQLDNGEMFILTTDSRVLLEDLTRYDSGGAGYVSSYRTPWYSRGALTQVMSAVKFQVIGEYEGSHTLRFRIYINFSDVPLEEAEIPSAVIDAAQAAGEPFLWEYMSQARAMVVSVEVLDNGEPNQTWRLEQIAIDLLDAASAPAGGEMMTGHSFAKVT